MSSVRVQGWKTPEKLFDFYHFYLLTCFLEKEWKKRKEKWDGWIDITFTSTGDLTKASEKICLKSGVNQGWKVKTNFFGILFSLFFLFLHRLTKLQLFKNGILRILSKSLSKLFERINILKKHIYIHHSNMSMFQSFASFFFLLNN